MAIRMQQRRGTAEQWTLANPVLGPGEIGFELDTNSFKIGDGVSTWDQLDYFENSVSIAGSIDDYVPLTQKGAANGVATLNSSGQIPGSQLGYVDEAVQNVIGLAPEALDTLAELADAIGDDPAFFTNIQQSVEDAVTEAKDYTDGLLVDYARGDGVVFTGAVILSGEPVQAFEAATKSYVDGVAAGLHVHESVVAATTTNIDLSNSLENGDVLDGVTLATGNRVLVKNQTSQSENGIYVVQASGAAVRAADYDSPAEIDAGDFVFVSGGTVNGDTGWTQTATVGTIGTDPVSFTQFSGAGTYLAGLGITLNGNTFAADLDVVASKTYAENVADTARQGAIDDAAAYTNAEVSELSLTIAGVETNLSASITSLSETVDDLSASTTSSFNTTNTNLDNLSSEVDTLSQNLTSLSGDVTSASSAIETLETSVTSHENQLDELAVSVPAIQTQLDTATADILTKAPSESPSFTGTVSLPSTTSIGDVSSSEIGHLNGVTSSIQTQLDAKLDSGVASGTYAPLNDPTFGGTVSLPSTTSIGDVSSTEIGYVNGVTSAIQTQLDSKAPSADPTFTGTVSGVTKAHVGLGNVDNTSDADKPVSTATQTALDAKASLSGANFTGSVEIDGSLIVDGDLTVNGTNFSASATSIVIEDNLVQIAHQNAANTVDLGLVVGYNDGSAKHAGIVRDVSDNRWKLFKGVSDEPATTVNFSQGSLDDLAVDHVIANGVIFTDGEQTKQGVPSITTISQKTASYTLSDLAERDTIVEISSQSATTLTIPADLDVNYPVGTTLDIIQTGSGQVTIAGANGVTVNATPGLKLRTQWSSATLLKRAANTWLAFGDLSA